MEGYIVLATGGRAYVEMAINLAASIKVMDPTRPICLIHEDTLTLSQDDRLFFDQTVVIGKDAKFPHVMNKIRVFDTSPYEKSMFVDADCLLVKTDIDTYWAAAATRHFSITGGKRQNGEWKGIEIKDILQAQGIYYLIQMNAGIFYFDKSKEAQDFFHGLENYFLNQSENLRITNYKGANSHSFELYLGLFMGMKGMDTENMRNSGNNSWMVSTWRAFGCDFRPQDGFSRLLKLDGFLFGLPFLPTRVTALSPSFAHFIGLRPRRLYDRLSAYFRSEARKRLAPCSAITR